MTRLVDAGLVDRGLERRRPNKGLVTTSRRLVHRPQGQPEEHQDLGRPAQAGRQGPDAEPVHLGRGEVEPARRLRARRDGGKNPQAGLDYVRKLITEHVKVQDKSGREALQTFTSRQRRRPPLLRVRGDHRPEEGRGRRLRHRRTTRSRSRIDDRRRPRTPRRRRRRSSTTCSPSPARRSSPTGATARSTRRSSTPTRSKFPEPARAVHDRRPRRLDEGQRRDVRPGEGLGREDRGGRGGVDRQVSVALPLAAPARARRPPERGARRSASSTLWLSVIVLLPLAAVVARSLDGGLDAFWDAVTRRQAVARCASRCSSSLVDGGDQRRHRHADRVGARARRVPRQGARQRAHRPAVRAADDRRRPRRCSRSTARAARSASTSRCTQAAVLLALLFVTLPFVIRSVQPVLIELDREMEEAAASLGARPRTIFRRDRSCPTCARRSCRGAALAFARAVGEFGSVVLISGNIPFHTQVASVYAGSGRSPRPPVPRGVGVRAARREEAEDLVQETYAARAVAPAHGRGTTSSATCCGAAQHVREPFPPRGGALAAGLARHAARTVDRRRRRAAARARARGQRGFRRDRSAARALPPGTRRRRCRRTQLPAGGARPARARGDDHDAPAPGSNARRADAR